MPPLEKCILISLHVLFAVYMPSPRGPVFNCLGHLLSINGKASPPSAVCMYREPTSSMQRHHKGREEPDRARVCSGIQYSCALLLLLYVEVREDAQFLLPDPPLIQKVCLSSLCIALLTSPA